MPLVRTTRHPAIGEEHVGGIHVADGRGGGARGSSVGSHCVRAQNSGFLFDFWASLVCVTAFGAGKSFHGNAVSRGKSKSVSGC